ncbi:hypothetical protein GCM10009087_05390 [Sphingomonas oligophenolica]|uniref:TRAP transporter small permease protein n=1 Tax=Sphingomonas oligophenolica TaxID=301154 RepID=A0ABU9XWV3_9SPHN
MSEEPDPGEEASAPREAGAARTVLLVLGSAGLLTAMAADAVAVFGRHVGFTLPGSIEVFQVAAVVALSVAILLASLNDRHAAVDLMINRASPQLQRSLFLGGRLALALTFALLCAGSIWVSADLWDTGEMTEVLAIPVRPFRLFWILCSGVAAVHFAIQFARAQFVKASRR